MYTELPDKFDMIFEKDQYGYDTMPGIWTLLGGLWILHLNYWGFNQYIIQRALGAKDIKEAQKGLVFAAALKLLMPLIIVLPGIAAVMLATPEFSALNAEVLADKTDKAYPEVMRIMPSGFTRFNICCFGCSDSIFFGFNDELYINNIYHGYLLKRLNQDVLRLIT